MSAVMLRLRKHRARQQSSGGSSSASRSGPRSQRPAGSSTTAPNASANDAAVAIPVKAVASDARDHFELRERIHCMEFDRRPALVPAGAGGAFMSSGSLAWSMCTPTPSAVRFLSAACRSPTSSRWRSQAGDTLEETERAVSDRARCRQRSRLPDLHLGSFKVQLGQVSPHGRARRAEVKTGLALSGC
jgi:hypothetical protein